MSHDQVRRMVENLHKHAEAVRHARREKHNHHQAFEHCKQRVAHCHESLRKHNAVDNRVKAQHGWSQRLHELRLNLDHAQKNQNHEYEQVSRANAHISNALNHFEHQRARVETEYNKVLKQQVPPNVRQMIANVHNSRWRRDTFVIYVLVLNSSMLYPVAVALS